MEEKIIEIDVNGYYLRDLIVINGEDYPKYYTNVHLPTNEEGEQLPFYRAKWNGTEWVEDMSQEEINELNNKPLPLSEIEKLRLEQAQANSELIQLIMMMGGA